MASYFALFALVASATAASVERVPPPYGSLINMAGASEGIANGSAIAEHSSSINVQGSVGGWPSSSSGWGSSGSSSGADVPALVNLGTGSNVGLSQYASNYQDSLINADGSSSAYQGNYASNNGYADEYLYGDIQGINATVGSTGWTAIEGDGALAQADALNHQGPGSPGWVPPPPSGWRAASA